MFKQLVKINVGARNLKRKKNYFWVRRVNCIFSCCVCILPFRFSIGVTSRLCSCRWRCFSFIQVRFFGSVMFTLGRHRRGGGVLTQVRKKDLSRLSLRGLSYLTLVKQTRAGLPNFVCCFYAPCEDQRRRHFSLK